MSIYYQIVLITLETERHSHIMYNPFARTFICPSNASIISVHSVKLACISCL